MKNKKLLLIGKIFINVGLILTVVPNWWVRYCGLTLTPTDAVLLSLVGCVLCLISQFIHRKRTASAPYLPAYKHPLFRWYFKLIKWTLIGLVGYHAVMYVLGVIWWCITEHFLDTCLIVFLGGLLSVMIAGIAIPFYQGCTGVDEDDEDEDEE